MNVKFLKQLSRVRRRTITVRVESTEEARAIQDAIQAKRHFGPFSDESSFHYYGRDWSVTLKVDPNGQDVDILTLDMVQLSLQLALIFEDVYGNRTHSNCDLILEWCLAELNSMVGGD